MQRYTILGQSNYAIAIILDTLLSIHGPGLEVDIVSNISPEDNDSLAYPYETPGVQTTVHFAAQWSPVAGERYLLGSIGKSRKAIVSYFREHFDIQPQQYDPLIHPGAIVAATAQLGNGVHISPGVVVAPYVRIGDFAVLNRMVSVGHHTRLDEYAALNPGVQVAGICHIGAGAVVGIGTAVVDKISIGADTIIGAGSVVTRSIPENVIAYGAPAKVVQSKA